MQCGDGHTRNCLQNNQWKGGGGGRRNTIATARKVVVAVIVAAIEYGNGVHIIERSRGEGGAL